MKRKIRTAAVAVAAIGLAFSAQAQTVATWNSASGEISTDSNWTGGVAPKWSGDVGTISSGVAQISSSSGGWGGTLNVNSGGTLEIQNGAVANTTWSDVRLNGGQITTSSGATRTYWGSSSSTLTLTGSNNQFNLAGTEVLQFYSNITGTGGLTYSGTKVLRLVSPVMDFTGDFRIESGRVEAWNTGGGSMPNATLDVSGGELRTYNTTDGIVTFGGLKGTGQLYLNRTADGTGSIMQEFRAGRNNQSTEFSGTLNSTIAGPSGVDFVKQGTGTLNLSGTVSYDGATRVEAGSLLFNGTQSGGETITIEAGAALGGDGTVNSDVVFEDGAGIAFDPTATLTANGTVDLGTLSVSDLIGLDAEALVVDQAYMLIAGSIIFDDVQNTSVETAVDIGDGKSAYFENDGGLKLQVIPEPTTATMVLFSASALMCYRRFRG